MQCITIDIQPEFSREFDQADFLTRVRSIRSPEIDKFEERGIYYLQFHFFTEFPSQLWQELKTELYDNLDYRKILAPISVAFCEGEAQDEFLLLHHFDPRETLDSFA